MMGDANDDGLVTGADFVVVQQNFYSGGHPSHAVPEPALIGLFLAVLAIKHRPQNTSSAL